VHFLFLFLSSFPKSIFASLSLTLFCPFYQTLFLPLSLSLSLFLAFLSLSLSSHGYLDIAAGLNKERMKEAAGGGSGGDYASKGEDDEKLLEFGCEGWCT
jgi:hypothetical protein